MIDIYLKFLEFEIEAELFNTATARELLKIVPCSIELIQWGDELYGPVEASIKTEDPVAEIPEGGIAYTNKGNYICIFFGQTPAWPVEHVGQIKGEEWKKLKEYGPLNRVEIHAVEG